MSEIQILFEDKHILVACTPAGLLSEEGRSANVVTELKKQTKLTTLLTVHRLDRDVSGVMLFAKHQNAAKELVKKIAERNVTKEYLAVINGVPGEPSGRFDDLLFKDSATNKSFVVDRERVGTRRAILDYELIATSEYEGKAVSLVKISLETGRTHQIRVQFSHRKMPLVGDGRYGGRERVPIALRSSHVSLRHPFTKKKIDILCVPDKTLAPWSSFADTVDFEALFTKNEPKTE